MKKSFFETKRLPIEQNDLLMNHHHPQNFVSMILLLESRKIVAVNSVEKTNQNLDIPIFLHNVLGKFY